MVDYHINQAINDKKKGSLQIQHFIEVKLDFSLN